MSTRNVLKLMVVLMAVTCAANAAVVLQDDFNGTSLDTSKWYTMTGAPGITADVTGTGELKIAMTPDDPGYNTWVFGIRSQQAFAIPAGQKLVVDIYGTNSDYYDLASNTSSLNCDPVIGVSPKACQGPTTLYEDWAYAFESYLSWLRPDNPTIWTDELCVARIEDGVKSGAWTDGAAGPESYTLGKYAHSIITIDANNINFYFGPNAYSEGMTPQATFLTSQAFTSEDLANGLYVYLMTYSLGTTMNVFETYDGVQVSLVPEPVTIQMLLGALCFGGLIRRK